MKTSKVLLVTIITLLITLSPRTGHAQILDIFDKISSAFDDVEKSAKDMLKQTVEVGGRGIDLGSDAIGAATEVAMNAKTTTYGAIRALNAKAFVYFRQAVPIPQMWDVVEKLNQDQFEAYNKIENARNASALYGSAVSKRMVEAAMKGDWESIWDFANGYTGYLTIEPQPNCPRPLMTAIFVYDPTTEKFRTLSMNPNLEQGNLTYVYAAPKLDLHYNKKSNPDDVNPYDLFIGAVGQIDIKTKEIKWDYSGPCPVLQKTRWKVDYIDGKFQSTLVADDGNIDSKPARDKNTPPTTDKPGSINEDMKNKEIPYCRDMNGEYSFPVNKGQTIKFGDVITLESVQYKYYLDVDDEFCKPLGILPGNDKQWIIVDPSDPVRSIGKPVPQQYKVALKSVSKDRYLDADDNCVTAGGRGFGNDKIWWFVQPDRGDSFVQSGHVLGLQNAWKNRFLDADDSRCTADGNDINGWDKQWRVQLLSEKPVPYGQEGSHPDRHTINVRNNTNDNWVVDLTVRPNDGFGRPFYTDPDPKMPYPLPASGLGTQGNVSYFPVLKEYARWSKELVPQETGGLSCYGVPREEKNRMFIHFSAWLKSTGKMVWDVYFDEAAGDHILLEWEGNKAWFHCGNIHYYTFDTGK